MTGCIAAAVIMAVCGVFALMGKMTLHPPKGVEELRVSDKEKAEPYFRERSSAVGGLLLLMAGFAVLMGYGQIDDSPWIGWVLLGLVVLILAYAITFCVVWSRIRKKSQRKGRVNHGKRL